jgi:hypothetical protein
MQNPRCLAQSGRGDSNRCTRIGEKERPRTWGTWRGHIGRAPDPPVAGRAVGQERARLGDSDLLLVQQVLMRWRRFATANHQQLHPKKRLNRLPGRRMLLGLQNLNKIPHEKNTSALRHYARSPRLRLHSAPSSNPDSRAARNF